MPESNRSTKDPVEEGLKDLFIAFLSRTEGSTYIVEGQDVKTRGGNKDFDYLLRETNSRNTLALEITLLFDSTEDARTSILRDIARIEIQNEISLQSNGYVGLPSLCIIDLPWRISVSGSSVRQTAHDVARQIIETARSASVGDRQEFQASIGRVIVEWQEGTKGVLFFSAGSLTWSTPKYETSIMETRLSETLARKNLQLDTEADRRALLIARQPGLPQREAIIDALNQLQPSRFENITEIFIVWADGIEKVYERYM